MTAVRGSPFHNGRLGNVGREIPKPQWERTPWWMFWRPYWRRWPGHVECDWEYRSKRQLAHEFLEKQFSSEKPFNQKHQGYDSRSWTGRPS